MYSQPDMSITWVTALGLHTGILRDGYLQANGLFEGHSNKPLYGSNPMYCSLMKGRETLWLLVFSSNLCNLHECMCRGGVRGFSFAF